MMNNPSRDTEHGTRTTQYAREARSTFWQLLKLAVPFVGWMALAALLGTATVGSGIGLMATSAWIIASAALRPSIADLQVAIVGVRFFGIARGVFRYLERYVSHQVTFRLLARLRVWFYEVVEPLAPARLMQRRSGDLLARIVADIETLEHFYVRVIAPPVVAVLIGVLIWVFMRGFDLGLAVASLFVFMISGVGVPLLTRLLSREAGRRLVTARAELNAALVDSIQGVADLVAFGQDAQQLERVRTLDRELMDWQARMAWIGGLHGALGSLLTSLAAIMVLVVAIPLVNVGQIAGIYLPVLVLAAMASFEAVLPLPLAAQCLESTLEAARRLFDIVHEPTGGCAAHEGTRRDISVSSWTTDVACDLPLASCVLRLENLCFRYTPEEPWVLEGISFDLPKGGCLAIVGPSGAGKSTLVNLLLRFWDDEEGSITLGGHDLREYQADDVRCMMGIVPQSTHLFNGTLRDNLLIAKPDATHAELEQAIRQAQLEAFIQSLPQGHDTWIGEQGLRLSGGERQRLAIARALLKDAPILILDEPTANLDPVTEREVMQSIHELMQGRTTLIVTHRLVGLDAADEILVLRAGRVVERGRHRELLEANGVYRRMWETQNQVMLDA
jgi:thiol reductant ABC exporter CydC subunit